MRILFISHNLLAGHVALLLQAEGHDVKLYIEERESRQCFDNMVPKVKNWRKELTWVGKDGLIVFDDVGYGKIQDSLRKKGYAVVGGCALGDKLEHDREFGAAILEQYGIPVPEIKDFSNLDDAVVFAKKNPRAWAIKDNGNHSKRMSYVGKMDDGSDVISFLTNALQNKNFNDHSISLQEKIEGVEIGVGRYFNGEKWIGPIEYNIEHPLFFPGDLGPITSEMGTLAWFDDDESNLLYQNTVAKMEPYLKEIGLHGDFEINCIVNEKGIFPLEITPRLGTPIIHLHSELLHMKWGDFLDAIARGKDYKAPFKKGYGIVLLLAIPPFPYSKNIKETLYYGMNVYFKGLTKDEMSHVHLEEVSLRTGVKDQYYIADSQGYVMYVTGEGKTVEEAQSQVYSIAEKIVLPKMFYRNDIGTKFLNEDRAKLEKWGYINKRTEVELKCPEEFNLTENIQTL